MSDSAWWHDAADEDVVADRCHLLHGKPRGVIDHPCPQAANRRRGPIPADELGGHEGPDLINEPAVMEAAEDSGSPFDEDVRQSLAPEMMQQ